MIAGQTTTPGLRPGDSAAWSPSRRHRHRRLRPRLAALRQGQRRRARHPTRYTDPSTGAVLPAPAGRHVLGARRVASTRATVAETREVTVGDGDATAGLRARGGQHHLHGARLRVQLRRRVTEDFDDDDPARGLDGRSTTSATARCGRSTTRRPRQPDRRRRRLRDHGQRLLRQRRPAGHVAGQPGDRHVRADRSGGRVQAGLQQPRRHRRRRRQRRRRRRPGRTVLHQTTDVRGPREDVLPLPMAAGESDVQVRFHNYEANFDWWWEVDDVFIGNRPATRCAAAWCVGNVRGATGPAGNQRRDRHQPRQAGGEGDHRRDSGRRGARRRLLLDVLEPDRTAPVRGHGKQYTSQTQAGQRGRRLGDDGQLPARRRPPDRDADQLCRPRRSSAATGEVARRSRSPTTGPRRSRWSSASAEAGSSCRRPTAPRSTPTRSPRPDGCAAAADQGRRVVRGAAKGRGHRFAGRRVGPNEAPWTDIADYPNDGDGQPGRVRRRRGLLHRRRQRQRV